jgi:2-C-methyl-D-erythritol 2,4-cyclodiphosphate synthase
MIRVGIGQDSHALAAGRRLVLGGVEIDHPCGLQGHSDADVLTHAVVDALLGAAALGTIGQHFPDHDPRYAGVSSLELLEAAMEMVSRAGWSVVNVDSVISAQAPRLATFLPAMGKVLAGRMNLDPRAVSVKATSPEGVGALGRQEAIAAQVVVLLESHAPKAA